MSGLIFARELKADDWPSVDEQVETCRAADGVGSGKSSQVLIAQGSDRDVEGRLVQAASDGASHVFVYSMDVLASLTGTHLKHLTDADTLLHLATGDADDPDLKGVLNAWTTARSRARSALAQHRARAREGEADWAGGIAPFGFRVIHEGDRRMLTPHAEEAPVVRRAVELVLEEGASLSEVVRKLNQEGITTRRGGQWRTTALTRLLTSPTLGGWAEEPEDDEEEPPRVGQGIVDLEEWEALQDALARPDMAEAQRTLLADLLRCGECGGRMHGRSASSPRASYYCNVRRDGGDCAGVAVSVRRLDEYVEGAVHERLQHQEPRLAEDIALLEDQVIDAEAELSKRERRRDRLQEDRYERDLYEDEPQRFSELWADATSAVEDAMSRVVDLRSELEELHEAQELAGMPRGQWGSLDQATKREVIHLLVDTITVDKAGQGKPFSEERVHIEWAA